MVGTGLRLCAPSESDQCVLSYPLSCVNVPTSHSCLFSSIIENTQQLTARFTTAAISMERTLWSGHRENRTREEPRLRIAVVMLYIPLLLCLPISFFFSSLFFLFRVSYLPDVPRAESFLVSTQDLAEPGRKEKIDCWTDGPIQSHTRAWPHTHAPHRAQI